MTALEGLSLAAADRTILPFPSHEIDPYRGMSPHFGVASARARACAGGRDRVGARRIGGVARAAGHLAGAPACRVHRPETGQDVSPLDLAELLVDAGFTREDPADEDGEFAVRGEIVDIFAAGDAPPVRLEFIGDTIETLRTYDPATQRSIAAIEQILVKAKVEIFTKTDLENRQVAMLRQIENDEQALKQENMTMASDTSAVRPYQNPSSVLAVHAMGWPHQVRKVPERYSFL